MKLSKDEIDALTEVINIGIGQAANSLNEIMEHHVTLQVPKLEIYDTDNLVFEENLFKGNEISSVYQKFDGEFSGSASLLFPDESARNLIANITGEQLDSPHLDSIRSSTLLEIGNIVINAIMGTITNLLKSRVNFSLPEYQKSKNISQLLIASGNSEKKSVIVLAETNFSLEELEINGFILLIFEVKAIERLVDMIEKYLNE